MQRLIFSLICTLLVIKPTANAIFLSTLGIESLPIAFLAVAGVALAITLLYNRYISSFSTSTLFVRILWINIFLLIVIGLMLVNSWSKVTVSFVFYLFISIFGILSASQFWIIANQVFNAREARKYFGFIGSGAIAGGIVGGYLASIISSVSQSEYIPFAAAAILLYSIYLVNRLSLTKNVQSQGVEPYSSFRQLVKPFRFIREISHLRYLAFLLAISVLVAKLIDYQFGYFATQFITDEEALTSFYGFWFSSFNIISLLIQLFLTSRIVGRFGVGYSLLILPFLIVVNAGLLLLIPVLAVVIGIKLFDASMKQSINRASTELMMLPVPEDIKLKTKTFLDVFVDSTATGVSGILLLFVVKALNLHNSIITIIILLGGLTWLYLANKMRKEYKSIFRQSLKIQSQKTENNDIPIIEQYKKLFNEGSEYQIIKALTFFRHTDADFNISEDLLSLLAHENPQIVSLTLEILMYKEEDFSSQIIPLLNHKNQNVQINAFEYLINHQQNLEPDYLITLLNNSDEDLQIAAIAAYAKEFQNNRQVLNVLRIEDRIKKLFEKHRTTDQKNNYLTIGLLKAISLGKFSEYYAFIQDHLKHPSELIYSQAVRAAGETRSSKFLKLLLEFPEDKRNESWFVALSKFGSKRINKVVQKAANQNDLQLLSYCPGILEKIPNQSSIALLQDLIDHSDYTVKNAAISGLFHLMEKYPLLKVDRSFIQSVLLDEAKYNNMLLNILLNKKPTDRIKQYEDLVGLLRTKIDDNLSNIFKLLHIQYPPEKYFEIYQYVKGPDQTLRDNSIEYLENTLGKDLKSSIIGLLEYNVLQIMKDPPQKLDIVDTEVKKFLLSNRDTEIKEAARNYYEG